MFTHSAKTILSQSESRSAGHRQMSCLNRRSAAARRHGPSTAPFPDAAPLAITAHPDPSSIRRAVNGLLTMTGQSSVATREVAVKRRSPTYELKFGLIGFAVGLSAVAGVAVANSIHLHARHASDSLPHAASPWKADARR
jgi:hypothetical protein